MQEITNEKNRYVKALCAIAKELVAEAENIVGDHYEHLVNFDIHIHLYPDEYPSYDVKKSYISKVVIANE